MLLDYIKKMQEENLILDECLDFMQLWYRDILMYQGDKGHELSDFQGGVHGCQQIVPEQLLRGAGRLS